MNEILTDVELRDLIKSVVRSMNAELNNVQSFSLKDVSGRLVKNPALQTSVSIKKSSFECTIRELILSYALMAEKAGPGSFVECIHEVENILSSVDGSNHYKQFKNTSDVNVVQAVIARADDVQWLIDSYAPTLDPQTKSMLFVALTMAGFGGRVIVEKALGVVQSCELVQGFTFKQSPGFDVNVKMDEVNVVCIDGYIESVSEINKLLTNASESKSNVLLFCRGLSQDVIHTLKVNYDRRTLTVIPVQVKFDLDGLNQMKDISIASGCELISSDRGDLISNVDLACSRTVMRATATPTYVSFDTSETIRSVAAHVNEMKKRRDDELVEDKRKLLDDRIRMMTPRKVIIRLTDDINYVSRSQLVDYVLRAFKSMIDHGFVLRADGKILTTTYAASTRYAKKCVEMLINTGAIITT